MTIHNFTCSVCLKDLTHESDHTTGYGVNSDDQKVCFVCCGVTDREDMIKTGRAIMYITGDHDSFNPQERGVRFIPKKITNWPETLSFDVLSWSRGSHNWGIPRYDVWFKGPDDQVWYGVHMGNWTQLIHCRRTKHTGYAGVVANYHGLALAMTGE